MFAPRFKQFAAGCACSILAGCALGCSSGSSSTTAATQPTATPTPAVRTVHKTIVFVWDGMRPDSIDAVNTPNLLALQQGGVTFTDNHSTYPTYTMANGAAFATGGTIGTTGFNGNNTYAGPSVSSATGKNIIPATGTSSAGTNVDFTQPQFTEDWGILDDLGRYYQANYSQALLAVPTLFQTAQAQGYTTAAVGKSGPAYLQDYLRGGYIVDENTVWPASLVKELKDGGTALPANTPFIYATGTVTLNTGNGNPTASGGKTLLADRTTSDPTSTAGTRQGNANQYLANVFVNNILKNHLPDLSLFWLRNPDATEHDYGPGTANHNAALQAQDAILGQIISYLKSANQYANVNIVVVSDHAHSTVSGPLQTFPLRGIVPSSVGSTVNTVDLSKSGTGYSVSGYMRGADLLTRAGFHAYDGNGCTYDPVQSGITASGTTVYPTQVDTTGSVCGTVNANYTMPAYRAPATLPSDAIVMVTPGGSEMYFVPSHNPALVQRLVTFLQQRQEYGPVFVDQQYGNIPGTFNASAAKLQNSSARNPDVIASMNFDETQTVSGKVGTTFNNSANNRGMHGSFSPIDVHNTLVASGPDFKSGYTDTLPTGNVDVAPTVAYLMGLSLPKADGRPLYEALTLPGTPTLTMTTGSVSTSQVTGLKINALTDPSGATIDPMLTNGNYSTVLRTKTVTDSTGKSYSYYDSAKTNRN